MSVGFFEMFKVQGIWSYVYNLILLLLVAFPLVVILKENRNPIKTIAWVLVLVLLPLFGFFLYLYFGRNFRKEKIFDRKELSDFESSRKLIPGPDVNFEKITRKAPEGIRGKIKIMKLLFNNSKSRLTHANRVSVLNNGDITFASIFEAIESATDHIHLEYYIIEDDEIGNKLKDMLIQKSVEGVAVRFIYDDVGSWYLSDSFIDSLKQAGVEVYSFMPVKFYRFANKVNYRNHRKIIVIDGKTGFVGGINIADRYLSGTEAIAFWRDTHLKIEGDAVRSLQYIFLTDWYFMSHRLLTDPKYFPEPEIQENCFVQITASGPDSDWASIMQAYFSAIATAQKYVYISTPYFLPNESIVTALRTAALSGIDVRIILPEKMDTPLAYWSSRSYVEEMLEAGIRIFFYTKGFSHSKLMIVDGVFCSVGTANMDIRSFDQNFEVNALIYDKEISAIIENHYSSDLRECREVTTDGFAKRPTREKIYESVARLFSPLL